MATSNFSSPNATKVYAVLMDYEDEDEDGNVQYRSAEEWDYEDLKSNLMEALEEKFKGYDASVYDQTDDKGSDLFRIVKHKMYGDTEISIEVTGTIESGYYEGAMLDYRVEYNGEEDVDQIESEFDWNSDMSVGLQTIQIKHAQKWAEKVKDEITIMVEEIYTRFSTPLVVVARFSNGETMYAKAE